jgi:hypothetical protein
VATKDPRNRGSIRQPKAKLPRSALLLGQLTGRRGPAPGLLRDRREAGDRRTHSMWSFLYGGLRPRRRAGRRAGDEHRIFLDWHEPRVLYLALAILLMSCADALFTLNLLAVGGEELNAFMRALLGQGVRWFLWAKIGLTAMGVVVLVVASRRLLLGRVRVLWLIRLFFVAYLVLIGWEIYLLGWQATSAGDEALDTLSRWVAG